MNNPDFISASTLAALIGCHRRTVARMVERGDIAAKKRKRGGRIWIARDDARRLLDKMRGKMHAGREYAVMKQR